MTFVKSRSLTFYFASTFVLLTSVSAHAENILLDKYSDGTISLGSGGGLNNFVADASATGRYIVFTSKDLCLDPAFAPNPCPTGAQLSGAPIHVFVRDRDTDNNGVFDEAGKSSTLLVSKSENNVPGDRNSINPRISDNGRYVTFSSQAGNLVPPTWTPDQHNIFRIDRKRPTKAGVFSGKQKNVLVSKTITGLQIAGVGNGATNPRISGNGKVVAFETNAAEKFGYTPNGPSGANGYRQILKWKPTLNTPQLITEGSPGKEALGSSYLAGITRDGRKVLFWSEATDFQCVLDTVAKPPCGTYGSGSHLYLFYGGKQHMLDIQPNGTLSAAPALADEGGAKEPFAAMSQDGKHVVFLSQKNDLVANDPSLSTTTYDVFVRDYGKKKTQPVTHRLSFNGLDLNWTGALGIPQISKSGRFVAVPGKSGSLLPLTSALDNVMLADRDPDLNGVFDDYLSVAPYKPAARWDSSVYNAAGTGNPNGAVNQVYWIRENSDPNVSKAYLDLGFSTAATDLLTPSTAAGPLHYYSSNYYARGELGGACPTNFGGALTPILKPDTRVYLLAKSKVKAGIPFDISGVIKDGSIKGTNKQVLFKFGPQKIGLTVSQPGGPSILTALPSSACPSVASSLNDFVDGSGNPVVVLTHGQTATFTTSLEFPVGTPEGNYVVYAYTKDPFASGEDLWSAALAVIVEP